MRALVALEALRELGHDACGVLVAMAILTLGDHLVLVLMTEGAIERAMLRLGSREECGGLFVACRAELGVGVRRIGHDLGHVRLVAFFAVSRRDVGGMGLVALGACGLLPVDIVAVRAVLAGMLADVLAELLDLRRMARKTGFGHRR